MHRPFLPRRRGVFRFFPLLWIAASLAPTLLLAQYASTDEYLAAIDTNGDGRVSLGEYQEHLSDAFRAMDVNRNEVIDLSEFDPAVVGPNTRPVGLAQYLARLAQVFHSQDIDHNGYLSARELGLPPQ
ncbi:MAG: hypothetical protein ABI411_13830 [Tahibacter sp.]